jgi:pyrimidine operon attenuation protein/uracil phosphoribosyltransferase
VVTGSSLDASRVQQACEALADAIATAFPAPGPTLLGISNGGIPLAHRLASILGKRTGQPPAVGVVDISFYRDDIGMRPVPKILEPTDIPGEVEGGTFILVDDVLHSGRTVRAALEEIFAQGRPHEVRLAVLVDRGSRRLPVQPDFTGLRLDVSTGANVRVRLGNTPSPDDAITITPSA